jgi:type IV secretory pathway TrbD component
MASGKRVNPVYRSISRPLTILGAERKLFFFAMCIGAATFNLLDSLLGGVLMFLLLYSVAHWANGPWLLFERYPSFWLSRSCRST